MKLGTSTERLTYSWQVQSPYHLEEDAKGTRIKNDDSYENGASKAHHCLQRFSKIFSP